VILQPSSGFLIVAFLTQRLPVLLIPEQPLITPMRDDVVDYGGRSQLAFFPAFCADTGEYTRSTTDFYNALENEGFTRQKLRTGSFVTGLALGTKADVTDDFLD